MSWRDSFSRDADTVGEQHVADGDSKWLDRRARAISLLTEADRIEPLVELVGLTALPDAQRVTRRAAQLLRDAVLRQSALSENDSFCTAEKQRALLDSVLAVIDRLLELARSGMPAARIEELDLSLVTGAADAAEPDDADAVRSLAARVLEALEHAS